jgi:hypothetical protein
LVTSFVGFFFSLLSTVPVEVSRCSRSGLSEVSRCFRSEETTSRLEVEVEREAWEEAVLDSREEEEEEEVGTTPRSVD